MILGITGGIGSGKSLVTDHLSEKHGFTAIKTDDLAREMMNSDEELRKNLIDAFGKEIYGKDGKLNREVFALVIHSDKENRLKSDSIVHPKVWKHVKELTSFEKDSKRSCNFAVETALPGSALRDICTEVWHVHSETEARIERLMLNRGYSREYAESVIRGQISEKEYSKVADIIIRNNGSIEELYRNVDRLIEKKVLI